MPVGTFNLSPDFTAWRQKSHTKPRTALSPERYSAILILII